MNKTFDENIQDIRAAKKGSEVREAMAESLEYVKDYAEAMPGQVEAAAGSAQEAAKSQSAAAKSAAEAAESVATAAEQAKAAGGSAEEADSRAAAASDSAAASAKSAAKAKEEADRAAAAASTDKTLTKSGAPADAKVVGDIVLPRLVIEIEKGSALVVSSGDEQISGTADENGKLAVTLPHDGDWNIRATLGTGIAESTVLLEYCRTKTLMMSYYTLTVTVLPGSVVSAVCDGSTVSGTVPDRGSLALYLPKSGTWTVTATLGDQTTESTVEVTEYKDYPLELAYSKVYGICWNYGATPTACTRLTKASDPNGLVNVDITTEPKAAVGTGAGSSPFDTCMPWSGMEEYNIVSNAVGPKQGESGFSRSSNGDVVVLIPDFWYKIVDDSGSKKRYYYIADKKKTGLGKHPGSGRYVGRYPTNTSNQSRTGYSPYVNMTRATARNGAKGKGEGWYLYDYATWGAIVLLYLVEYADWGSQAKVGRGYCDGNNSAISAGGTDSMVYHTGRASGTDGKTAVQYRHIENPWGNVRQWVDGINFNDAAVYACTDPSKYADDTSTGYTNVGTRATSSGYISALGMSTTTPWAIYPTATGGSETTYVPDRSWYSTGWLVLSVGGGWNGGSYGGLLCFNGGDSSSYSHSGIGARHLFVP